MKYDVIIAGGGASGMTAAITAARRGCSRPCAGKDGQAGEKRSLPQATDGAI